MKIGAVSRDLPRRKAWQYPRFVSEHAFDKLRSIDCTFAEFEGALEGGEVIEETDAPEVPRELVLALGWKRPLHVVVVVDNRRNEERIVTVYEPDPKRWSSDYRRRR